MLVILSKLLKSCASQWSSFNKAEEKMVVDIVNVLVSRGALGYVTDSEFDRSNSTEFDDLLLHHAVCTNIEIVSLLISKGVHPAEGYSFQQLQGIEFIDVDLATDVDVTPLQYYIVKLIARKAQDSPDDLKAEDAKARFTPDELGMVSINFGPQLIHFLIHELFF